MSGEKSYVIGTHDAEIGRLGVQHRVWRSSMLDLWGIGGLTEGMTALDVGAGPGHATMDMAGIVGPAGRVIAIERSQNFLSTLRTTASAQRLANIETIEADLLDFEWPKDVADFAWCRWVLAFVNDPAKILRGIAHALKPGGAFAIQEYYDYGSWHMVPPSPLFDSYVGKIIARWRASGGNADIGLSLPRLLVEAGLKIETVRPVVFTARMQDFASRWPMGFAREHLPVMLKAGDIGAAEAREMAALLDRYEADPDAFVVTPGVLQIAARKPM